MTSGRRDYLSPGMRLTCGNVSPANAPLPSRLLRGLS
jgi:hypothetical protein